MKNKKIEIDKEENLTLKEFEELISFFDLNEEGENLYIRMWSGGGSYILDDAGNQTQEFETIYDLAKYLKVQKANTKKVN